MTSRHWKDLREKESFIQQLREFRDGTLLSQDLDRERETFADAYERQYWDDVRNGLFDDDPWDDWDDDPYYDDHDYGDDDWQPRSSVFDIRDDWECDGAGAIARPGYHVRVDCQTYLVLENGRWANLLTGKVVRGNSWVSKESIVFGDD